MEMCGHCIYSYILLGLLMCTSPQSIIYVPLEWSTSLVWAYKCLLQVTCKGLDHIVLLASLTSHIYRGIRYSFHHYHHYTLLFVLIFLEWFNRVHEETLGQVIHGRRKSLLEIALVKKKMLEMIIMFTPISLLCRYVIWTKSTQVVSSLVPIHLYLVSLLLRVSRVL